MDANCFEFDMEEWLADRREALLSMDRNKILGYSQKYYCDDGYYEDDDFKFWVGVHMARTGAIDLPEFERRVSMAWLKERGFEHFAYDLVERDAASSTSPFC